MGRPKKLLPNNITVTCINGAEVLVRHCPRCANEIQYKGESRRWNIQIAIKNNTVCNKCNPAKFNNKTSWNIGIPMSAQAKIKNSLAKRGKSIHSAEYKAWLSKHGTFARMNEYSVVIQAYLHKHKITYQQYINNMAAFKLYKRACIQETNQQDVSKLIHFDKRGKSGIPGAYQLDHKLSIKEGFDQTISPNVIGHISNLHFIPWKDNIQKSIIYKNKGLNEYIK